MAGRGIRVAGNECDETTGDGRREHALAGGDELDGAHGRGRVLEEEAGGVGTERRTTSSSASNRPRRSPSAAGVIRATAQAALEELRGVIGVLREGGDEELPQRPQPTIAQIPELVEESRAAGMRLEWHEASRLTSRAPAWTLRSEMRWPSTSCISRAMRTALCLAGLLDAQPLLGLEPLRPLAQEADELAPHPRKRPHPIATASKSVPSSTCVPTEPRARVEEGADHEGEVRERHDPEQPAARATERNVEDGHQTRPGGGLER